MLRVQGYVNRHDFIPAQCRGKDVLDIGMVLAPSKSAEARKTFFSKSLHMGISEAADKLVGIDLLGDEIRELKSLFPSLRLYEGDVEELSATLPAYQYEVIVMGDIIEHLSNPGRALEEVRGFLAPAGKLYISCPNALGLPNYVRFLLGRSKESPDHVQAHTKYTLTNLLSRHGFRCSGVWTGLDLMPETNKRKAVYRLGTKFLTWFPEVGGTLIVQAELAAAK